MNLRHLSVFHAIMSAGTATGAGTMLGVSQPAISKSLKHMEDELGVRLFERIDGRLRPTPEAHALLPEIAKVFGSVETVRRVAEELRSGAAGSVGIASIPVLANTIVPRALERFHCRWPLARVAIQVLPTRQIVDLVTAGQTDIGIVTDSSDTSVTRNEDLVSRDVVCILPAGHELAARPEILASDLAGTRLACYDPQTPFGQRLARVFEAEKVPFDIHMQVATSMLLCGVVEAGLAVGLIEPFALVGRNNARLVVRPFRPTVPIRLRMIFPPHRPVSLMARMFADEYRRAVFEADAGSRP